MSIPDVTPADVGVIGTYLVVLALPGGLLGALAGLRGWSLAAAAPLFSYAIAGLAGPLYAAAGIGWSASSFAIGAAAVCAVVGAGRLRWRRRARDVGCGGPGRGPTRKRPC